MADGDFTASWADASKSPAALAELMAGIPGIYDPDIRDLAYPKVKPILAGDLPPDLAAAVSANPSVTGRFVRVELPRRGTLTLAEVQVFSAGANVAPAGKARQSSISSGGDAARAIDGRTDGAYGSGTQTHSAENENRPWWELDLKADRAIESISIWNRTDGDLGGRLDGFTLIVLDANRREVYRKAANPAPSPSASITLGADLLGAINRAAIAAAVSMTVGHDATFESLAKRIDANQQVSWAARGIRALPRKSWPKSRAGNLAKTIAAWAKTTPASTRSSQEFIESVQFAHDLAGLLPADHADALRKELKEVQVAVFVLTTVREQMRYDTPRLVVEAGKQFEIIFENTDFMPHNLVIVTPGSRKKVGELTAAMRPDETDGRGRAYVPTIPEVISSTRLLEAGQRQTLTLTAPLNEGEYEYVCTYPGHWEQMWGKLIITKDVDAYLKANPDAGKFAAPEGKHKH
jgi:azurin